MPGRHGTHRVTAVIKEKIEHMVHGPNDGVRDRYPNDPVIFSVRWESSKG